MKERISVLLISLLFFVSAESQTIQDARKLTDNEQYEAASGIYKVLISSNPSDAVNYFYYGDNLFLEDNADSAKIIFDKGKSIDPNNPFLKIGFAKLLLNQLSLRETKAASEKDAANPELRERFEQATTNAKDANALIDESVLNSKDANLLTEAAEALIHLKTKDLEKAKTLLDKALLIDGKNIEALLSYGDIYTELNNGTLAADYYNRALDLDRKSARAIVSKGRLYKRSTNYEGAAQEFKNAISIDSSYAPAHRELGETYIKLGKLTPAKEEYKKYLELSKNNCGARIRYAYFLYVSKNYSDAVSELNQAKQRCDSNSLSLLRVFSYSFYELKEYDKGLIKINQLFQLTTPDTRTSTDYEFYGKLLVKTSQDSTGILNGIEQLRKALSLDPSRIDLLSDIADAQIKAKQYANAIETLKQKIAIGKDVKVLDHYNLGSAYYYNKQFVEADSAALKVNELSPTYASGWMLRARINAHIDSTSESGLAKPYYEKYIEIALSDTLKYRSGLIESYGYLAYYYILKNDKQNGLIYLKKKLEFPLEPEDKKNVQQAIDQLEGRGPKPKK